MAGELKVPWVVGRQRALARAVAMHVALKLGKDWSRLTHAQRDSAVRDADDLVQGWVRDGVLACFIYDYREQDLP